MDDKNIFNMNFKAKNHMKTKELEKRKNKRILLKKVKQIKMDTEKNIV